MSVDITVADTAQLGVEQVYWHLRQSNKKNKIKQYKMKK